MSLNKSQNTSKQVNSQGAMPSKIVLEAQNNQRGMAKNLLLLTFASTGALILSLILNIILLFQEPNDRYFTVDNNLRIVQLTALNEPYASNAALTNWSTETVSKAFTLSFANWRQALTDVSDSFEPEAFDAFVKSYKSSGNLSLIIDKRLASIVNLDGPAVITAQGVSPQTGRYTWVVQIPILINYESTNGVEATQRVVVDATIQRVSTLETPRGIRILRLVTSTRS